MRPFSLVPFMPSAAFLYPVLAVAAGALLPVQGGINAKLASGVGGPIVATAISFMAGLTALAVLTLVATRGAPNWAAIRGTPPWMLITGGLLGATYLSLNVLLVSRIGSGAMMAFAIAGQMLAALLIDAYGLFGLMPHALSPGRLAGGMLVVAGAVMVRFL
jgi:bacterial/archaeal transporter family-2 protein